MWEEKFKTQLREYQKQAKKLSVTWDAGGDDQILHFSLGDDPNPNLDNEVYSNLIDYLVEEFELPHAGENYNEGGGTFSLEDDGRILFEFDQYAYADLSTEDEDVEEFSTPVAEEMKALLTEQNNEELSFYGSISFLKETSQYIQFNPDLSNIEGARITKIRQEIKKIALARFKPPHRGSQINYSGTIDRKEIYFDSLNRLKYTIFEDDTKEKMYVFEER